MPLLGVIPKALEGRTVDAMADPKSALSEGYNSLRSSLLYSTAGGLPRTLLITSSQPAEGKSTSSVAVARSLARLGRKVVLIDVDLRRPALHAQFAVPNEHGMSTLLTANDTPGRGVAAFGAGQSGRDHFRPDPRSRAPGIFMALQPVHCRADRYTKAPCSRIARQPSCPNRRYHALSKINRIWSRHPLPASLMMWTPPHRSAFAMLVADQPKGKER
jgi:hypothetical protein